VKQIGQLLLSSLLLLSLLFADILQRLFDLDLVIFFVYFQIPTRNAMNEFDNAFESGEIVFVLTRESILMPKVLYELYVGVDILQYNFFFDLQERVDARGEKHIGTVWLPIQARFLKHYRDDTAEVNEHGQLCFWCLILVQLEQLLNGMFNSYGIDSCFIPSG
jgi:hypothetical protein